MLNINFCLCCILIANSVVSIILSVYAFSINPSRGSRSLALLALISAVYSFGYGLELVSPTLQCMLTYNLIQYLAIPYFCPLWLVFSVQMTHQGKPLNKYFYLIFVIPLASTVLRYTSSLHRLFYIDPHMSYNGYFNELAFGKGIMYYANGVYSLICIFLAIYLYIRKVKKATGFERSQLIIIILSQTTTIIPAVITAFNILPWNLDLAPFGLPLSIALLLTAMLKYRFLNPEIMIRSKVFEWSNTGILVLDTDLNLIDINPAAIKYYPEYNPKHIGLNIKYTLDKDGSLSSIIKSGSEYTTDMLYNGRVLYYKTMASKLVDRGNTHIGYMISFVDLTDHMNIVKKLEKTASTDALTGIMTRRMFDECSESKVAFTLRRKTPVSFLILDIDNFKSINDTYGHLAGDMLLKDLANICKQNIREFDLLGRMGGDEFVVLFPDTHMDNSRLIAERIRVKASEFKRKHERNTLSMTISIGVTGVNKNENVTLQTLYKYADIALYRAKNNGRNRVECQYVPDIHADGIT